MPTDIVLRALIAGLIASIACGLGALPLLLRGFDPRRRAGAGYAFAGGMMIAASVYNLILPGITMAGDPTDLGAVLPVVGGILLGTIMLTLADRFLRHERFSKGALASWGGRTGLLILLVMSVHSVPEGVAVGVGYASELAYKGTVESHLGHNIALAISIHNIPEGLAVAIPIRAAGASIGRCFGAAFLTSLPQPIAAIPAVIVSWLFHPLMTLLMGFAAGAMIFLVILELIPDALMVSNRLVMAWSFTLGFCLMLLIQVIL